MVGSPQRLLLWSALMLPAKFAPPSQTRKASAARGLPPSSHLLALEARMLFDGAALATHDVSAEAVDRSLTEQAREAAREAVTSDTSGNLAPELLVVDSSVQGWQALAQSRGANVELLVIEQGQDAVALIAQALSGKTGYSAVHVVSHGDSGQIFLGGRTIDANSLAQRSGDFATIGQALDSDADILLYGCDLASNRAGMEFLQALANATQADVAASTDKTGSIALGGDWDLEVQLGAVSAQAAFSADAMIRFDGLLTNTVGTLEFSKTIVQDDVADPPAVGTPTSFNPVYLTNNPQSLFNPAGDASASPLTGPLTNANVGAVESQIQGVDAGDTVRIALVLRNTGPDGLWDICLNDDIPAGLEIVPGQDNLRIVRGDGLVVTALNASNVVATIADLLRSTGGPGTFFHLQDPSGNTAPVLAAGSAVDGSNILVITYDARVRSTVVAGSVHNEVANVFGYALSEGGAQSAATFDSAAVEIALPTVDKVVVGTNRAYTAGTNVVIGEVVTYEVTLKVPEGVTAGATFIDTLPAGMTLVQIESITPSAGVTIAGGIPAVSAIVPVDNGGINNEFSVALGNITNANSDNAVNDVIVVRYTAVVRDVVGNQSGTTLTNNVRFGTIADPSLPSVTVVEPAVTVDLTSNLATAQVGDIVTYTLTINSTGQSPAFDVILNDLLPAGLTYVGGSLTQVSGQAPDTALAFVAGELTGIWNQLDNGNPAIVITFQAQINSGAAIGAPIDHQACATFTSLPGHIVGPVTTDPAATTSISTYPGSAFAKDQERTGADGLGGAVDDYVAKDGAPVTVTSALSAVLRIVESSQASTGTRNTYDAVGVVSDQATVGEVVRYRMVVQVPEGGMTSFKIATALPDGLQFVNDGSVTLALVGDAAGTFTSSTLADGALNLADGGTPSSFSDITGVLPVFRLPSGAIQNLSGGALATGVQLSGADVCFVLGDLNVSDLDGDKEFVVIEFNAIVANEAANQSHNNLAGGASTTTNLDVTFTASFTGDLLASNMVRETIVEPVIVDVLKTVTVPSGAIADPNQPTTISYTVTFTNSGATTAYDVRLSDTINAIPGLTLVNGSLTGAPGGATVSYAGNALDVQISSLAAGGSVSVTYQVQVAAGTAFASNPVNVTYSSLENTIGDDIAVNVSSGGVGTSVVTESLLERTGASGAGADSSVLNNYADSSTVGLAALSGCLWADLSAPNDNTFNGTDTRMNGVTVTLRGAGLDGLFNTGDDLVQTTVTQTVGGVSGCYAFTALPPGDYRIIVPTNVTDPTAGAVQNAFDAGTSGSLNDGIINVTLLPGDSKPDQNFVYVQPNLPPDAIPDTNATRNAPGSTATGNVVGNGSAGDRTDIDPENQALVVCGVAPGTSLPSDQITTGLNTTVVGTYGSLVLQANGSYVYTVNATLPAVSGLTEGATITDLFSYTIKDPAGNTDTTTLTITITGGPRPPDSADRTITIPEDTPRPLTPGDFAFTDPDVGDALKCVIITTLPDARQGVLLFNGTPVTIGQRIDVANLGQLVFDPLPNVNRGNYPAGLGDPNFTFQVCDKDDLLDPTPNRITFIIDPVNDAPNPYPEQLRCFDQTAGSQGMDNQAAPGQTLLPAPLDPDLPAQILNIVITGLPTGSGIFLLDGNAVVVGQTLTVAEWGRIQFRPDPAFIGTRTASGAIDGGQMSFRVSDGAGGQVNSRLNILIKPAAVPPPVVPPPVPVPPVPVPPEIVPPPIPLPPLVPRDVTPIGIPSLDAGNMFDSDQIMGLFGDELIGPFQRQKAVADNVAEAPIEVPKAKAVKKAVADCDAPAPKAKPKAVKRMVLSDKIVKPSAGFTEQVKAAKQKFRPPAKVTPKVARPDC
jgi:uncharacterized repeat protein (TIGR01451 family)/fimbrial isopeptide formation D2 family protein